MKNFIFTLGNLAAIVLSDHRLVWIDRQDIPLVENYRWHFDKSTGYIWASIGGRRNYIHRHLTNCPIGMVVDHWNHHPWDNCRSNLRIVTPSENQLNRLKPNKNNRSGFCGVNLSEGKWESWLGYEGRRYYCGRYNSPEDAFVARNEKLTELRAESRRRDTLKQLAGHLDPKAPLSEKIKKLAELIAELPEAL